MTKAKNRSNRQTVYKTETIKIEKPVPGKNAKINKIVKNKKASEKYRHEKMDRKEFEQKFPFTPEEAFEKTPESEPKPEPSPEIRQAPDTLREPDKYVDPYRAPEEKENSIVLLYKNIHLFTREEFQSIIMLLEGNFDVTAQINNGKLIRLEAGKEFHGKSNLHINIYQSQSSNG